MEDGNKKPTTQAAAPKIRKGLVPPAKGGTTRSLLQPPKSTLSKETPKNQSVSRLNSSYSKKSVANSVQQYWMRICVYHEVMYM